MRSFCLLGVALWMAGVAAAAPEADVRLADAAKNRDRAAVRALLARHASPNATRPDGTTALHWAVEADDIEIADLLIKAGAHVNVADGYGVTPLLLATTNGSSVIVERLLRAGANPNAAHGTTGETPLLNAARTGRVEPVKLLLARAADVNAVEPVRGQTALMWAAAEGHTDVVRVLIEHRADVEARSKAGYTPLLFAARIGDLATTRVLLAAGAKVNEAPPNGPTPLLMATIRRHLDYARFLLEQGADPNSGPGFTPLHWAVGRWGHRELASASSGVPFEGSEWSFLYGIPRGTKKVEFVKLLLAHGADPNARARRAPSYLGTGGGEGGGAGVETTPFYYAAEGSDVDVMRVLLAAGADPLVPRRDGTTPLMAAAGVGYSQGSDPILTDGSDLEALQLCVELGGDVNTVNAAGETALHGAAYRENGSAIVRFLVEKGARMNVKSRRGWTPLVIAEGILTNAQNIRSPEVAATLVKLGAEPSPPDAIRDQPTIDYRLQQEDRQRRAQQASSPSSPGRPEATPASANAPPR